MPRDDSQNLKLLYMKDFFEECTDEDHPAKTPDILAYLEEHGVKMERKSVYPGISALEKYGLELTDPEKERNRSYYLRERDFETSEVKMILDSVASSKFLSERKSLELMNKLKKLVNVHHRHELDREVKVAGRVKTMNDSTINNLDHVHDAIAADMTLKFKYFHYNMNKEPEYTKDGKYYEVSPWVVLYDNSYYYLLAYVNDDIRTFRIDRMKSVHTGSNERQGKEQFESFDLGKYTKQTFGMFSGEEEKVEMLFHNSLIDTVIDKFGKEVFISPVDDAHFKITVPVAVSPQFFGWIFGLGGKATILGPKSVVKKMKETLKKVSQKYE